MGFQITPLRDLNDSIFTIALPLLVTSSEDSPTSRKACLMLTEFANINEGGSEALGWLNALHV